MDQTAAKLEKVLSIVPCHRKKERCIHVNGTPFPLCARCMSILLGYLIFPFLFFLPLGKEVLLAGILLNIPMVLDGWTQKKGWRESHNVLRVITGLLAGIGQSILIVEISKSLLYYLS